ncbi:MAG: hypothetical protein U5K54_04495 [Cytophagales bacterium]|nr:hypothetical protein [Cytophagales bacterium]
MEIYSDAVKDVLMIILIIGGAGALKQTLIQSGVDKEIGNLLDGLKYASVDSRLAHCVCDPCLRVLPRLQDSPQQELLPPYYLVIPK